MFPLPFFIFPTALPGNKWSLHVEFWMFSRHGSWSWGSQSCNRFWAFDSTWTWSLVWTCGSMWNDWELSCPDYSVWVGGGGWRRREVHLFWEWWLAVQEEETRDFLLPSPPQPPTPLIISHLAAQLMGSWTRCDWKWGATVKGTEGGNSLPLHWQGTV